MSEILKGSTDVTRYVHLQDATTGASKTGLTIADLDLQYVRNRTAPVAKVDAVALAATDTAHTDNRMIEVDATDQPGLYRVDWPDAAFVTGVDKVILTVKGSLIQACHDAIDLIDVNKQDGVRMGLTALPNAAAEAAGGLFTRGSGAGQINQDGNGRIDTNATHFAGTAYATAAAALVAAVWDALSASFVTANSIGKRLVDYVTGVLALDSTVAKASNLATAQADLDTLTGADGATLATTQGNYAPSKAGDAMALTSGERTTLAAVIWNALTSGMSTVGSIGKKLADWTIHSAADVWTAVTRTLTAATNITSTGGTTVPQTGDSFARLGVAGAGLTALGDTRLANLDATVSSRATPAQVNTEMLDVLVTDTFAEPSAVPLATASIKDKVGWVTLLARNKRVQDATDETVYADNGSTPVAVSAKTSTASEFTRGEWT